VLGKRWDQGRSSTGGVMGVLLTDEVRRRSIRPSGKGDEMEPIQRKKGSNPGEISRCWTGWRAVAADGEELDVAAGSSPVGRFRSAVVCHHVCCRQWAWWASSYWTGPYYSCLSVLVLTFRQVLRSLNDPTSFVLNFWCWTMQKKKTSDVGYAAAKIRSRKAAKICRILS
jgi:hypothetical protein